MISISDRIKSFDGIELYYAKDIPENPRAIIVIVHGVSEHLGRYEYLKDKLNSFGYGVYRFDNRGHGKSGGERGDILDFNELIEDADTIVNISKGENMDLPIFMLGHSMGGFITAAYGVKYPGKVNGQILSGAATNKMPFSLTLKSIKFPYILKGKVPNLLSKLICRDPEVVKKYEDDPLVLKETTLRFNTQFVYKGISWLIKSMPSYVYPCLILHGSDDRIVPKRCSQSFYDAIASKDKTLKFYEGFYHEIFSEKEKDTVIEDVHEWIEGRI
jgi:acylglycerol lipase